MATLRSIVDPDMETTPPNSWGNSATTPATTPDVWGLTPDGRWDILPQETQAPATPAPIGGVGGDANYYAEPTPAPAPQAYTTLENYAPVFDFSKYGYANNPNVYAQTYHEGEAGQVSDPTFSGVTPEFANWYKTQGFNTQNVDPGGDYTYTVLTKNGQIVDSQAHPKDTGSFWSGLMNSPLPILALGVLTGGAGLGLSPALAGAVTAAGTTALRGGDLGDVLTAGLKGGVTGGLASGISSLATPIASDVGSSISGATGSTTLGDIASGAVKGVASAVPAATLGKGGVESLISGAETGALGAGVSDAVKAAVPDLSATQQAALAKLVTPLLAGKDLTAANVLGALPGLGATSGLSAEEKAALAAAGQVIPGILSGNPASVFRGVGSFAGTATPAPTTFDVGAPQSTNFDVQFDPNADYGYTPGVDVGLDNALTAAADYAALPADVWGATPAEAALTEAAPEEQAQQVEVTAPKLSPEDAALDQFYSQDNYVSDPYADFYNPDLGTTPTTPAAPASIVGPTADEIAAQLPPLEVSDIPLPEIDIGGGGGGTKTGGTTTGGTTTGGTTTGGTTPTTKKTSNGLDLGMLALMLGLSGQQQQTQPQQQLFTLNQKQYDDPYAELMRMLNRG